MIEYTNTYRKGLAKKFIEDDYLRIMMVHRRVYTDLWKKYGLNGYELDMMLCLIGLCKFEEGVEVTGKQVRSKFSMRFQRVMDTMIIKLVGAGYIINKRADKRNSWHRLSITWKAIEFFECFIQSMEKHMQDDYDSWIMTTPLGVKKKKDSSSLREGGKKNNKS